jgi:hypothetical protein
MVLTGLAVGGYVNPLVALCVFPREDWVVLETSIGHLRSVETHGSWKLRSIVEEQRC